MQSVIFGLKQHERLTIAVHGYERPAVGEFYDDNWLRVVVSIHCGAFRGEFDAAFLTSEIDAFRQQASVLYESLKGRAEFQTLEEQLSLSLTGDGLGHIELRGEALDQPGIGNRLSFTVHLDQTELHSSLQSLNAILATYPVRT